MSLRIDRSRNVNFHALQYANHKLQTLMELGVAVRLRGSALNAAALRDLQKKLDRLQLPFNTFLSRVDFVNNLYAALCAHGIEIFEINLAPSDSRRQKSTVLDETVKSRIEILPAGLKAKTNRALELGAIKVRAIEKKGQLDLFEG
jgi:hypothetical protein